MPLSGIKNTTRVVSGGDYLIKDTKIGPARVNSLHLSMDKNLNGHLKADEASADLDQLLQIMDKKKAARWYTRLFLKKKELTCSLATPIHQRNIDLKQLKITKLKTSFNLPVPTTVIDHHTCRLSIAGALHEYGIQLIRPEYIELITTQLEIIKKGSSGTVTKALKSLLQLAKETASTPDHAGAMTLMARKWPLDFITNLLTTKPLPVGLLIILSQFHN